MTRRLSNTRGRRPFQANDTLGVLLALVASATIIIRAEPGMANDPATTPGSLVVERMGDGSTTLGNGATPVFLNVFNPDGTPAAPSIALPQSAPRPTVAPFNLMDSGSASSDGLLTRSANGLCLQMPGYNGIPGEALIVTSANKRTIGVVTGAGAVDTSLSLAMFSGNNFRSVVSVDGTAFWAAGTLSGSQGVVYVSGGSMTVLSTVNTRCINIFNNQLYYSTGSGTAGIYALGSGLPTSGTPAASLVIAVGGTSPSPYAFQINPVLGVAYVADDRTLANGGGIIKYTSNGSAWSSAYTLGTTTGTADASGTRGLTVDWTGANPIIYATTTETSANRVIRIVDTGSGAGATLVATAPANTVFRGLDFAPFVGAAEAVTQGNPAGMAVCANASGVTYTCANVTGATGYGWAVPAGAAITAGQGTTSITVTWGGDGGAVSVTPTNYFGSGTASSLTVTVNPVVPPSVGIVASPPGAVCPASTVTFTAMPTNGGVSPGYVWKKNGSVVGDGSGTYTASGWTEGDTIDCQLTSTDPCASSNTAEAPQLTMSVTPTVAPSVSISAFPGATNCGGTPVTFSATAVNGGISPSYQWQRAGLDVSGATHASYAVSDLTDGEVITCKLIPSPEICASPATAVSSGLAVKVDSTPPVILCPGNLTVEHASPWSFGTPLAADSGLGGVLVYDNSVNDLVTQFDAGTNEVGNEILLAGTERYLEGFSYEFWSTNLTGAPSFEGANVTVRLRFYANDGTNYHGYATPETLLYDSGEFWLGTSTTPRATVIYDEFDLWLYALYPLMDALPSSFTWTVQFSGMGANDRVGVDLYSPPVIGHSYGDFWLRTDGGWELRRIPGVATDIAAQAIAGTNRVAISVLSTVTNATGGGSYAATRTWRATDACGNFTDCSQTVTVLGTAPLVMTCTTNKSVEYTDVWTFDDPIPVDAEGTNSLMVLSTTTNWTCGVGYVATRVWQAMNAFGNSATCTQVVTVVDTTPPVILCPGNLTVECSSLWSFGTPLAADRGLGGVLVYDNSVNDLVTQFDAGTNEVGNEILLAGTERYLEGFSYEFWSTNLTGAPSFEGANVTVRLRFYANDGTNYHGYATPRTLLYDSGEFWLGTSTTPRATVIYDEFDLWLYALYPLMDALPSSFTWTVQFSGMGANDRVGVDLYSPPVIGHSYGDFWLRTDGGWELRRIPGVTTDIAARAIAGTNRVVISVLSTVTNATGGGSFAATRTWRATDACGNFSDCSQTVTMVDTTPPVITWYVTNVVVLAGANCQGLAPDLTGMNYIVAVDNCSSVTVTQSVAVGAALGLGTNEVAVGVLDAAGNAAYCTNHVVVVDLTAPVITQCPANRSLSAGANCLATLPDFTAELVATDACGMVSVSQSPPPGTELGLGNYLIGFTVSDAASNTSTCALLFAVTSPPGANTHISISEFMAKNTVTITDENGTRSDWIEIHNSGPCPVSLDGWSLTDDVTQLTKWRFPATNIAGGQFMIVWASDKNRRTPGAPLHANFKLTDDGEYLALVQPDGVTIATQFSPAFPPQLPDGSYGLPSDGVANTYLAWATPGLPNSPGTNYVVADLSVTPGRGWYTNSVSVSLGTLTTGVTIYYTTDGSEPGPTNGFVYAGPLVFTDTTVLRAAAYRAGFLPALATHTYAFPLQMTEQTGAGFPTTWGTNAYGATVPAIYRCNENIVGDPRWSNQIPASLLSLPTVSIAMKTDELFGPNGIYSNPLVDGVEWERPCSIEYFRPDGQPGFQINCGIRMQGVTSRDPLETPKHNFRVLFKQMYGTPHLAFDLFPGSPVQEFDTLVMHGSFNDHWFGMRPDPARAQMQRDQWCADTQRETGGYSAHGTYVQLYVNGLYWGMYNLGERPDASFQAHYLGGQKSDYDAYNFQELKDGTTNAWAELEAIVSAGVTNDAAWSNVCHYLNVPGFIDYMLINFYAGNQDWPWNNYWKGGAVTHGVPFHFFNWDAEMTFLDISDDMTGTTFGDPGLLYSSLRTYPEFRTLFSEHAQQLLSNGGALTPERCAARWMNRAQEIDLGMVAESARWEVLNFPWNGGNLLTHDDWIAEQTYLLTNWFPRRTDILISQLQRAGLYPDTAPPVITWHMTNLVVAADSNCQAVMLDLTGTNYVVAVDNCSSVTVTQSVAANTVLGLGTNAVVLGVVDAAGNVAYCTNTVVVMDQGPPVVVWYMTNVVVAADANCQGAMPDMTGTDYVVAVDNCSSVTVTQSVAANTVLGLGTNEVVLGVVDAAGNAAYCTNSVVVADQTPPSINCPADLSVVNDAGQCGAVVNYSAPVGQDNCSGAVTTQVGGLASGSFFPVGKTTNTFNVTDVAGNIAACSFVVTVEDAAPPLITWYMTNVVVVADTNCQAAMPDLTGPAYLVAMDNCGSVTVTQSVAANTVLGLGTNEVVLGVLDAAGNVAYCTNAVVVYPAPPVIVWYMTNVVVAADANCQGAMPDLTGTDYVVAVDNCSSMTVTQSVAANTVLGLGTNEVVLGVVDARGNAVYCTNSVVVADQTPPSINCPADLSVVNDAGQCGAVVNYSAPVGQDNCSGAVTTQVGGLASGSFFPVGKTTNTFNVTDVAGNIAACSFVVTVEDAAPPVITWHMTNVVVVADPNSQGLVPDLTGPNYVVAVDNCGSVTVTQSVAANTVLGLGTNEVVLGVLDAAGNVAFCTNTVVVFPAPPVFAPPGGIITESLAVSITTPPQTILYYTTNGSDPRLSDGSVSPGALVYDEGPAITLVLTEDAQLRARAFATNLWSTLVAADYVLAGEVVLSITRISQQSDGSVKLEFLAWPGVSYTLLAATNLTSAAKGPAYASGGPPQWVAIATLVPSPDGTFSFVDAAATNYPVRFYRLTWP